MRLRIIREHYPTLPVQPRLVRQAGSHRVTDGADATDALGDVNCIARVFADQQVLKAAEHHPAALRGDDLSGVALHIDLEMALPSAWPDLLWMVVAIVL